LKNINFSIKITYLYLFRKEFMKKTLIVSYTPREGSNTKKLLDHFVSQISGKTEIEFLD